MPKKKEVKKFIVIIILTLVVVTGFFYFLIKYFSKPASFDWNQDSNLIGVNYDGCFFEISTTAKTVENFLKEHHLSLDEGDYVFPFLESPINAGTRIIIKRKIPLNVKVDSQELEIKTFQETISEVLAEANVELNHLDKINYTKESKVFRNMEVVIIRINEEKITEEEKIDFETIEKNDPDLKWRKTLTEREGETGIRENTYLITYADGKQIDKTKISSRITKKPITKVILHGTKIEVGETYKGKASWYSHTGTMACASLKHPLGTWLRVTNTASGKSIIVQVNDRGPFSEDKIIDLDKKAFEKIGSLAQGTMQVKVEEILD
jgi:uncharacterized protein YabE (DUF348 family)